MIKPIHKLVESIKRKEIEIYNEFSLQHELGITLRADFPEMKVQFERNVAFFFPSGEFIKKEIDISVFLPDKSELIYAIELKFPRNGQYPEQMFSFCKDILFAEQLRKAGFKHAFSVIFADDPLFYSGKDDGIYRYFRNGEELSGTIVRPTGNRDERIELNGIYHIQWNEVDGKLKYALLEANSS